MQSIVSGVGTGFLLFIALLAVPEDVISHPYETKRANMIIGVLLLSSATALTVGYFVGQSAWQSLLRDYGIAVILFVMLEVAQRENWHQLKGWIDPKAEEN